MISLIGYTGFVGSNICAAAGGEITGLFNSRNIKEAYGTAPDLLIYAGLRAEKYLANHVPEQDMGLILQAEKNIQKINPKKLILISTIDVFKLPQNVYETSVIETDGLHAYGYNRYQLELWARKYDPNAIIIRLPGLFGKNIKKNFIYDYINIVPSMLKTEKFEELSKKVSDLKFYYKLQNNGFYKLYASEKEKKNLKLVFKELGFSALNFTDSRSKFQFYNLKRLWKDIQTTIEADIKLWHPATEPISAAELYKYLEGKEFFNELSGNPADYDYKTIYDTIWGGKNGYIADKHMIMDEIKKFVCEEVELTCKS